MYNTVVVVVNLKVVGLAPGHPVKALKIGSQLTAASLFLGAAEAALRTRAKQTKRATFIFRVEQSRDWAAPVREKSSFICTRS
jgi:hypothetical protein